ncbi:MAG: O-antigen ligase family protein [Pirellulales bacterium]
MQETSLRQTSNRAAGTATGLRAYPLAKAVLPWGLALSLCFRKDVMIRFRWGALDYTSVDSYAALEIAIVLASCAYCLTNRKLAPTLRMISGTSLSAFFAMYGWGLISSIWSEQPSYSLFQALEVLSQLAIVLIAVSYAPTVATAETSVLWVSMIATLCGIGQYVKLYGFSTQLSDWHTNHYTATAAILLSYCFAEFFASSGRRRIRLMAFGGFAAFALLLGTSATSIIAALTGFAITAMLLKGNRWPLIAIAAIAMIGAALAPDVAFSILFPGKTEHQVTSLHGREHLWGALASYIWESPIVGHGFAMGAKLGSMRSDFQIVTTNTHNSFLSVVLGMGFVGVLLASLAAARFTFEIKRNRKAGIQGSVGVASAVVSGVVNGMGIGILGETWRSSTLAFAAILALHAIWICPSARRRTNALPQRAGGRRNQVGALFA